MAITSKRQDAPLVLPKSDHVADPSLRPFLQPAFDPVDYLNATLPSLALSTQPSQEKSISTSVVSLADLSSQAQSLLSQLNAQASRLTTILTQLTDDILRSGGRLAYEVELLRGEAAGLSETLNDQVRDDVTLFKKPSSASLPIGETEGQRPTIETSAAEEARSIVPNEPLYITQLRTFTHVRHRLDSVVKVFGDAMQWTLPPSEVSLTSSFISVSAPEPGADSHSREEKGREFTSRLRAEIADLIISAGTKAEARDVAAERIAALNDLAKVWKGTAEEKARVRFVESLAKLAEERLRDLDRDADGARHRDNRTASPKKAGTSSKQTYSEKGNGFLDNLHRMRHTG